MSNSVAKKQQRTGLRTVGATKNEASQWRKLAAAPKQEFNKALEEAERPTTAKVVQALEPSKPEPNAASKRGVKLWNRLHEMEREYVGLDPDVVLSTMEAVMLDDVHRLAPRIAAWLKRIGELS